MTQAKEMPRDIVKTDEVIGVKVEDANGQDIGTIKEIALDKVSGQARYVVLSFGGFLGMGDKYFALPWKTISYNEEEDCFVYR